MRSISVPVSLGIVELPKDANMKSVTVLALLILIGTNSVTWCGQSGIVWNYSPTVKFEVSRVSYNMAG